MKRWITLSLFGLLLSACASTGGMSTSSSKGGRVTIDDLERSVRVNYELGTSYVNSANYEAAEEKLLKAVSGNPNFPDVYNALGVLQERRGKVSDASDFFAKAISLDPYYEQAMVNYTRLLCKQRGKDSLASTAAGSSPNSVRAGLYAGASECAEFLQQSGEALQYAELAIMSDPTYPLSYYHQAQALLSLNRGAEALAALDIYHDLKGYTYNSAQLGLAAARSANNSGAIEKYQNVLQTQFRG